MSSSLTQFISLVDSTIRHRLARRNKRVNNIMLLNLDGGATVLFPYLMDQDPEAHAGSGWVTSLDWTPADLRFQVDRKVNDGKGFLCPRTLELSEVQGAKADTWRPRDSGSNMR
jgi:hypothetical protein